MTSRAHVTTNGQNFGRAAITEVVPLISADTDAWHARNGVELGRRNHAPEALEP